MNGLIDFLNSSYTAYHAAENAESMLLNAGFIKLKESEPWKIENGGRYFVTRGSSSIIAFKVNAKEKAYFKLVCSHTDSPALKLKENPEMFNGTYLKLNAETYGGGIWYSFLDRPLKIAGRIVYRDGDEIISENVVSSFNVTIPSLAVHMNRGVNESFSVNPQVDLLPLASLSKRDVIQNITDKEVISYDLYAVPAEEAFYSGIDNEFLSAPRTDNLTSVYASVIALLNSEGEGITVAACFDNEEVGSSTLQGAGSDFLKLTLERILKNLGLTEEESVCALSKSVAVSLDNAHAIHPNHPEKCDPTNQPVPGGGVVIKSHANKAYCTDARSSAFIKRIFDIGGIKYQTFFNRSDMRSGSTLGAISLKNVSVMTVDLGIAQLAMHSAVELFAAEDYKNLVKGLIAFYVVKADITEEKIKIGFDI